MKIKFLGILLVSGLVALTSCTKDAMMSDAELIHAIQKASKQEVDATQLPGSANAVLSEQFADYNNARTLVASELGYEVQMTEGERPDEGFEGDISDDRREEYMLYLRERRYLYFDLDGRPLGERPDDGSEDGDRPDDGSEDGDEDRPDDGSEEDDDEDRPDDGSEEDGDEDRPDDGSEEDGDEDRPDDGSEEDGDEDRPEEADDTDRG